MLRELRLLGLVGILSILLSQLAATPVLAETIKITVACHVTRQERTPNIEEEKHFLGMISRRGLAFFEDGDIASYESWETYDQSFEKRVIQGYALFRYLDGTKNMLRYHGEGKAIQRGEIWLFRGECEYVLGTGRFEGIHGKGHYSGKRCTPYSRETGTRGDAYFSFTLDCPPPSQTTR